MCRKWGAPSGDEGCQSFLFVLGSLGQAMSELCKYATPYRLEGGGGLNEISSYRVCQLMRVKRVCGVRSSSMRDVCGRQDGERH